MITSTPPAAEETCPTCGGKAWDADGNACPTCGGNGVINR